MAHYLDHAVGSDLSYRVFKKQRTDAEIARPPLHQAREVAEPIFVNKALRALDHATPGNQFIDDITPLRMSDKVRKGR